MPSENLEKIRNFCIIAHIDHGKSTLADRMLEITGTIDKRKMAGVKQRLDLLELEQEKGITIKLTPVRMMWKGYLLNLIDTPGHVDFTYEVSRSLAACEGAILLVDSTQGIEAQTVSNLELARSEGLKIIPVVNKIDLPNADKESTANELCKNFGFRMDEIIFTSGKTGEGVEELLDSVIERIDHPVEFSKGTQALIFDSVFDAYKGVIAYVRVFSGEIKAGEKIFFMQKKVALSPIEVGIFSPERKEKDVLTSGEVGYIATGIRDISKIRVGDTITKELDYKKSVAEILPGYKEPKPVVFSSFFPTDQDDFPDFKKSFEELSLNDAGIKFEEVRSNTLGQGFRCGFLGVLHLEIAKERLEREFNQSVVVTSPTVRLKILKTDGTEIFVESADNFPDYPQIEKIFEPIAESRIFVKKEFLSEVIKLINSKRGTVFSIKDLDENRLEITSEIPLLKLVSGFFSELKGVTSGYASLDYKVKEYKDADFVKVLVLVNKEEVEALSFLTYKDEAESEGRKIVEKLKELIPRHMFVIPLQAAIGGKIIARETIPAIRKDVTAKLYGGDFTRRQKLLRNQAKGKKKMREFGNVSIPKDVFLDLVTRKDL